MFNNNNKVIQSKYHNSQFVSEGEDEGMINIKYFYWLAPN